MNRRQKLDVDRIVDAACEAIADDGLARFSMRRLGARLGVDPMAVYHHVGGKRQLLSLVMGRVVAAIGPTPEGSPWDAAVRHWASAYWQIVAANRELVAAGLADPEIAAGGIPAVGPLHAAVAASGLPEDLVDANVYLVVDFVHGSALGSSEPLYGDGAPGSVRELFDSGLDTIIAGISARSADGTS